jgi:D-alanyl-D-alanine dipeptidase
MRSEYIRNTLRLAAGMLYNRRLLHNTMTDAGFVNLPSEWWHFDYGDQLWAWANKKDHAIYGAAQPDFRWGNTGLDL